MQVCVSPVLISVLIMARKSGDMILPVLAISSREFRIRQTELDIVEIAREGWSCKSLHVLENKCARAELPHGANGFPPHVTLIKVSPMFAANRERLARWSAGNEVNVSLNSTIVEGSDVALVQWPPNKRN